MNNVKLKPNNSVMHIELLSLTLPLITLVIPEEVKQNKPIITVYRKEKTYSNSLF